MYINSQSRFNAELILLHFNVRVIEVLFNTEYTEWKRDFDVYWRIMKLTVNITKKYCCLCLIYLCFVNFSGGFLYGALQPLN